MRNCLDRKGEKLRVLSISGEDGLDGILEGTPYKVRLLRIGGGKNWSKKPGHHFFGLEELEQEIATIGRDHPIEPPRYRWQANLATDWDWGTKSRRRLAVMWYQEDKDPFDRLQEIVARLDVSELHTVERLDDNW